MSIDILIATLVESRSADMLVTVGRYVGDSRPLWYSSGGQVWPTVGRESVMSRQISGGYSTATV